MSMGQQWRTWGLVFAAQIGFAVSMGLLAGCGSSGNQTARAPEMDTATPVISPAAGTYTSAQNVTITDSTTGAVIYYTTDGSAPNLTSKQYTGPIPLSASGATTINAVAEPNNPAYLLSQVATATYTVNIAAPQTAAPTFSPAAGAFTAAQNVTLTDATTGAVIYYTTDGSTPTTSSPVYLTPIAVTASGTTTINAIAVAPNATQSTVATAAFTLTLPAPQTAAPTVSPAAGTFTSAQNVTLTDATAGAVIYYTTNGSAPTASSTPYAGAIPITAAGTTTINAIAVAPGDTASTVTTAAYVLNLPTAAPTFSVAAGTYTAAQSVTLADATTGAVIYYTTDGSAPTTSSTQYTGAISIATAGTTTLNAIAVAPNYSPSTVASAAYVLTLPTAAPTFSVAGGTYTAAQSITLADATTGAVIYYTTDGSVPTTSSTVYTAAISIAAAGTTTINAIAVAPNYGASTVASAAYTLNLGPAPAPSYTYSNVQIVGGGFVDGLFFHPKSQGLMYARTDVGGAYRWNNVAGGDAQWVPLTDFVGRFDSGYNLGVESLGLDPNDPTKLYLAVGEYDDSYGDNGYILSSSNMGNSFTAYALPFKNGSNDNGRFAGERLSVDPANSQHIYFGTAENGLWQSTNQGASWTPVTSFPVASGTATVLTGKTYDPGAGVVFEQFLSTSGSANGNTKTVYVGVSDPTTGLYVSIDGGMTFSAVAGQPTGFYVNASTFDPSNRYLYLSYARQANVTGYQQSTPCTSNCTSIGPSGPNDGQIWRYTLPTSTNPSGTWTNITPPLLAGETSAQYASNPYGFSSVAIDPSNPDTVMVTTLNKYYPPPDDDVFRSLNDGQTWADYGVNIKRDGSLSPWINFGQSTPDGGNWLNHVVVDPFNANHVMYGDGQTIWQTTDALAVDGNAGSTTAVAAGNATNWSIGALGVEETVINGLISPPSGPANLLSVMYDLGGFTHTTLTKSLAAQQSPQLTNGWSIDYGGQAPLDISRVGTNTGALGSAPASEMEAFSSDGGITWTANASLPVNPSTGAAITQGEGTIAVSADGSTLLWIPIDPGTPPNYSTDHGATWHASVGAPAQINQGYNRIVVAADRVNAKTFYAFSFQSSPTTNDGTATTYISTNGGQTFTVASTVTNAYPTGFFVSPAAAGDLWTTSYNGLNHSTDSGTTFTAVLGYPNVAYGMGFGAPATGQTYPALYMIGQLSTDTACAAESDVTDGFTTATECIYRSTDEGQTFIRINDYNHQFSSPTLIVGDPRVFGRFYLGTPGRGIVEGDSPN